MNPHIIPPAITPKQFMEYAGLKKDAVYEFMKKCPQAVVSDYNGRRRIWRSYADAFTTNTIHELDREHES